MVYSALSIQNFLESTQHFFMGAGNEVWKE
jgi:hypothetical protein